MKSFTEIIALQSFINENHVSAKRLKDSSKIHDSLEAVLLSLDTIKIEIHIQDEYNDLNIDNRLLPIVLCLRELELIEESTDYLNWLQFQLIKTSTEKLRAYYQNMVNLIPSIRLYFPNGTISSFIPDLDFELNSNSAYYLRVNLIT